MDILLIAALIAAAYLLGSIPSAVWIGKRYYGVDIREHGSRNAGTTNMLRVLGRRAALPVFALDFLKGFGAVALVGLFCFTGNTLIYIEIGATVACVIGHMFPVFAGFRGGKGVATLVGAITGIAPLVALMCLGVWCVVLMIWHYVSLASLLAGFTFPIFILVGEHSRPLLIFACTVTLLLIFTHRKNIGRLAAGTESKTYIWRHRPTSN